jgi:hypothetical protein
VRSQLQTFLEQAIQESAKDMKQYKVYSAKIRSHFQNRLSLLVYSASQISCFGIFVLLSLAIGLHKGGCGGLGPAPGLDLAAGADAPLSVARSVLYVRAKRAQRSARLIGKDICGRVTTGRAQRSARLIGKDICGRVTTGRAQRSARLSKRPSAAGLHGGEHKEVRG